MNLDDLTKSSEILKWFWDQGQISTNGKKNNRHLNSAKTGTNKVRYEEHGPYIYAIILQGVKLAIEVKPQSEMKRFTLVKVGFTQQNTSSDDPDSRINKLKKDIKTEVSKVWKAIGGQEDKVNCTVLFCLSIDALETTPFFDIEDKIRNKTGIKLPKRIGKALGLPVHTEWVVTTNKFTGELKKFKDGLTKQRLQLQSPQGKPPNSDRQSTASAAAAKSTPVQGKVSTSRSAASPSGSQDPDNLAAAIGNMTLEDSMIDTGKLYDWMKTNHQKYVLDASPGVLESLEDLGKYKPEQMDVSLIKMMEGEETVQSLHVKKK